MPVPGRCRLHAPASRAASTLEIQVAEIDARGQSNAAKVRSSVAASSPVGASRRIWRGQSFIGSSVSKSERWRRRRADQTGRVAGFGRATAVDAPASPPFGDHQSGDAVASGADALHGLVEDGIGHRADRAPTGPPAIAPTAVSRPPDFGYIDGLVEALRRSVPPRTDVGGRGRGSPGRRQPGSPCARCARCRGCGRRRSPLSKKSRKSRVRRRQLRIPEQAEHAPGVGPVAATVRSSRRPRPAHPARQGEGIRAAAPAGLDAELACPPRQLAT